MVAKQTTSNNVSFERLYSVTVGATAANLEATQTTTRLDDGVSAEITHAVIRSPLDSSGDAEALRWIGAVIDGKEYDGGDLIKVRGDLDPNQMPPTEFFTEEKLLGSIQTRRKALQFGIGLPDLYEAAQAQNPGVPLMNTTLKVKPGGQIAARMKVGNTATTDNTVIEFYGWRYSTKEVLAEWIARIFGQAYNMVIFDRNAGRRFILPYAPKTGGVEKWGELPGGQDQAGLPGTEIQIRKFIRYAKNASATTPNQRYVLDFETGKVDNEYENMKFDLGNSPEKLIIIQGIGVQPYSANMQQLFVKVNGQNIPNDGFRCSTTYNPLRFGRNTETSAAMEVYNHRFVPFPIISPVFIHGETGKVELLDNGTAIPDGSNFGAGVLVCLEMIQIVTDLLKNQ